jgi:hypothetical protein
MLWPTVSRPVCLWCQAPIWGVRPDFYYCQDSCGFVDVGLWLWREDGSAVYNCCWPSPAQSFSGPSPLGLVTIFYCLRFETSLIVASYDSQGYGGGIRPRLHTVSELNSVLLLNSVSVSKEMFVEHSYPRKHCLGFQESTSMKTCLSTRSLATGLHVTIYSEFLPASLNKTGETKSGTKTESSVWRTVPGRLGSHALNVPRRGIRKGLTGTLKI